MQLKLGHGPFVYDFEFTIPDVENVGLFLSGGLDSSALLCCIIEELNRTNRSDLPLHIWTCNKPPDPINGARMVKIISEEYNRKIIYHDNYDVPQEAIAMGIIDISAVKDAYDKFDSIQMYLAGNNSWEKTQWADLVNLHEEEHHLKLPWHYPEHAHITYPFLNLLKLHTIDIYYKLGKEHLMAYTHSCSKQEAPACEACYSCREAAHGFKMLGKQRPSFIPHEKD